MAILTTSTLVLGVSLAWIPVPGAAVPGPEPAVAAAKSYGFTVTELERVLQGDVLTKALKEGSDKELAGVVAIWLPNSVAEFTEITLEGTLMKLDPSIGSLDAAQQAMLEARQSEYRKSGLKSAGPPGELLALAIDETRALDRRPGYAKALLAFPSDSLPGMEHRFFAYEQQVEGARTFILSHRSALRGDHDALITEQRYYVSQAYECRFIASDCYETRGGTLLFYVTRIFTDRVAGLGSGLKHALGRRKMLADVAEKQKRAREQLAKATAGPESRRGGGRGPRRAVSTNHEHQQEDRIRHPGGAFARETNAGRGIPISACR